MILHPMVEDAKEAVGSMGDDTPLAVLSEDIGLYTIFLDKILVKLQILLLIH
ncbi:MAG: hypothetical protein CM1200mP13_13560 [Candidatus Pelagibacterales bacterium]|nr:MAG: hypothetical protein CM1200mP13_13560 [Pelagibacterales bacterium]